MVAYKICVPPAQTSRSVHKQLTFSFSFLSTQRTGNTAKIGVHITEQRSQRPGTPSKLGSLLQLRSTIGFIHRKTSKKKAKLMSLHGLAVSRLTVARRPRAARKSIASGDVGQFLALSHLDRAPTAECDEGVREAAAGLMFAAGWCGDLPELLFACTILADKFGSNFTTAAKEGTDIVDPMLVWKLSGDATNMELKTKVTKEIAAENNILADFSELPEAIEDGSGSRNVPHRQELGQGTSWGGTDDSSESDDDHPPSRRTNAIRLESSDENVCGISNSDGPGDGPLKPKVVSASVRTRR